MTQSDLVQLAQSGDATAIATLMNATLQAIGVTARVALREHSLYVLLESERRLAQHSAIEFIRRGIARLGVGWLSSAIVCSRMWGEQAPLWVQKIELEPPAIVNPFVFTPQDQLELERSQAGQPSPWPKVRLLHLLLLTIPLLTVFSVGQIWSRYLLSPPIATTESSVGSLVGGVSRSNGPDLLPDPADARAASNPFAAAIQQANQAVAQSQTAQSRSQWHQAAASWWRAIALMKAVPDHHPQASIAQQKVADYQRILAFLAKDHLSQDAEGMSLKKVITGELSPKSIAYSGDDRFFVQNMMYGHTITVYDRTYQRVKTIPDQVTLANYGYPHYPGSQQGAPVEATFTQQGKTAWVSNYQMYGEGFGSASDTCNPSSNNDSSFLYRIDAQALTIDRVIQVGAVPKFVAGSPDDRLVLVSNWCSWDVSVINTQTNKEIRRVQLGPYPRGIAIDAAAKTAYVAIMGAYDIAAINLSNFSVSWIKGVGRAPRHLNLDPNGRYLYATLNGEGSVAKIDLAEGKVVAKVATGRSPRSMAMSGDGQFLYVVNYNANTVSKIRTMDLQVVQTVRVNPAPIGITYDPKTNQVWVACYSGSILVFQD